MDIRQILTKYWGYTVFRPLQEEIITSVLDGRDTLALLPTGGGKSICYQVPALAKDGLCIVISPLIALMKDQVGNLRQRGILASALHSGMSAGEIDLAVSNCIFGKTKLLYLAPERLYSSTMRNKIGELDINLIAVDEAHCISQWGYDFRPAYLNLAQLRTLKPEVPILALTASATQPVIDDIQAKLAFRNGQVIRKSFKRENLAYVVLHEENKNQRILKIADKIKGSGIIYVRNRKKTREIADFLNRKKIKADCYHAGLKPAVRDKRQDDWMREKTRIIVCTNAFGMGIDKPNVRFVLHIDLPESPEMYFQEAGRAGRDGKKAYAVLLYNAADVLALKERIALNYPSQEEIKRVYQALANYYQLPEGSGEFATFDFEIHDFCSRYNLNAATVFNSLKILESENHISATDAVFLPSKLNFKSNRNDLYKFQVENGKHDLFIKVILRSYAGIFEDYVKISEAEIAKRSGLSTDETVKRLKQLHRHGILSYVPSSDKPKIQFVQPRADMRYLTISQEKLAFRKNNALERMKSIIRYVTGTTKCRSRSLLDYFGEKEEARCGICDVCLERNKLDLSNLEFENVAGQLKSILSGKPLTIDDVIRFIKNSTENKTLKVIQWLLDNNKIQYNDDEKLTWKK